MVHRVLSGKRLNGSFGFDVSKPGFDVLTANIMQMAFSSDYKIPKVVIKGTVVSNPTNGPGPGNTNQVPGAQRTTVEVGYGRSISPYPFVACIATAPNWTIPLTVGFAQLTYLNSLWHSEVFETCSFTATNYGGQTVKKDANPSSSAATLILPTWASACFTYAVLGDRIRFSTNNRNAVTIKYLVLENA